MTNVMAAINGTPVGRVVLAVAEEVARVLGADVEAVHVVEEGKEAPDIPAGTAAEVAARRIPVRMLGGAVEPALIERASSEDVRAVVMGLRRTLAGARPAGHVALGVIVRTRKPVIVVPPITTSMFRLRKVLVPVRGRPADGLEDVMSLTSSADLETVFLHIHDEWSVPSFEDQPHYDLETWAQEFLARWVPGARPEATMELRVGAAEEQILEVAQDVGADMIAIGWTQNLSPGRATVVRWALEHTSVPLALMPLAQPVMPGSRTATQRDRRIPA
jgi:nucleotide-binding universal stress UspA family protein